MPQPSLTPGLSPDAAIVIGLAGTAVPFAFSRDEQAERWLRVLRLYGQVGQAMQALGVGEAPLESHAARPPAPRERDSASALPMAGIERRATELAGQRGAPLVTTAEVLFAVLEVYGSDFERALYRRGTTPAELIERLALPVAPVASSTVTRQRQERHASESAER